jgi:hypothetical protein
MKNKTRRVKYVPVTIGKIWAKWCPHCISLIPVWHKMKKLIGKNTKTAPTYMETEEADLNKIDEYNQTNPNGTFIDAARGYPTIYKIVGGKVEYYSGAREPKLMAAWALNKRHLYGGARKLKSKKLG